MVQTSKVVAVASVLLLECLWVAVGIAQPADFSMEVAPADGTLSDQFVLTVRIETPGIGGAARYWDPDTRDFVVLDRQRRLSNASRIDKLRGQVLTAVEVRRYVLRPKRAGRLYIGSARVRFDESEYETRSLVVRVRSDGSADIPTAFDPAVGGSVQVPGFREPPASRRNKRMFLHVVSDKKEAFIGEQVTLTWLLYTRDEVLTFEPSPPDLADTWNEVLFEPSARLEYTEARVGGTPYLLAAISQRALFATRAGLLRVSPFDATVADSLTSMGKTEFLRSEPLDLVVKPLPEPIPNGFDSAYVGQFHIEALVDRRRIEASSALTLTLTVRGTGALRRTSAPALNFEGFEFQSPRDYEERVDTENGLVGGERTYRYWTTPTRGGELVIPAIELTYFDPVDGRFETARTSPIAVDVYGDPTAVAAAETALSKDNVLPQDIKLIRMNSQLSTAVLENFHRTGWFWFLALAPASFLGLALVVDKTRERLRRETPRARLRRARGRSRQRLRSAEIHLRGNRPPRFFGELARVIQENLEERLGQPLQSLTRDEMKALLLKRGFERSTVMQVDEHLERFDFARFAPSATGQDEMREALEQAQALLRRIERQQILEKEDVS